jgi:hypothetical protein
MIGALYRYGPYGKVEATSKETVGMSSLLYHQYIDMYYLVDSRYVS